MSPFASWLLVVAVCLAVIVVAEVIDWIVANGQARIVDRRERRARDARVADLLGRFPANQASADALHQALIRTTGRCDVPPHVVPFSRRVH